MRRSQAAATWSAGRRMARLVVVWLMMGGCLVGCATGPSGPQMAERSEFGYACSAEYACPAELRCYRRFPISEGRCVTPEYYQSHPRGCHSDRDCETTEICQGPQFPKAGVCLDRWDVGDQSVNAGH